MQLSVHARDEDVGRFNVAMHKSLVMGMRQSLQNLTDDAARQPDLRFRLPLDQRAERMRLHILHHEIQLTLRHPQLVEFDDVWVSQLTEDAGLTNKKLG